MSKLNTYKKKKYSLATQPKLIAIITKKEEEDTTDTDMLFKLNTWE